MTKHHLHFRRTSKTQFRRSTFKSVSSANIKKFVSSSLLFRRIMMFRRSAQSPRFACRFKCRSHQHRHRKELQPD
ncbi:hypothetical protein Hanom_Chr12g01084501 [Helianthus anomalus]